MEAAQQLKYGVTPAVHNVVATVNLGCMLNLKQIVSSAKNAEYNPRRFSAVIIRIRDPRATALVFATGKVVCTGAKSEECARTAARKVAIMIRKTGHDTNFTEFKIQNVVGSCDVRFPIRLESLKHGEHGAYCEYEPEIFPGLVYRMSQPTVVLLIFTSGKVVLTGAKDKKDICEAFDNIYPQLTLCRR
eukprot:Opistho-1_new@78402